MAFTYIHGFPDWEDVRVEVTVPVSAVRGHSIRLHVVNPTEEPMCSFLATLPPP